MVWLHHIIPCTALPASLSPTSTISMPSNTTVSVNAIETVIVYPRSRDNLDETDREIRAIITTGKVTPLISEHGSELKGIVVWFVEAEREEIQMLGSRVAGVSILIILPVVSRIVTHFHSIMADSINRLTSNQMTLLLNRLTSVAMIGIFPPFLLMIHRAISNSSRQ